MLGVYLPIFLAAVDVGRKITLPRGQLLLSFYKCKTYIILRIDKGHRISFLHGQVMVRLCCEYFGKNDHVISEVHSSFSRPTVMMYCIMLPCSKWWPTNGNIFRDTGPLCAWINGWVNNRQAGDLRRQLAHYDITVMPEQCMASCDVFLVAFNSA